MNSLTTKQRTLSKKSNSCKWTRNKKIALVASTIILVGAGVGTYFALKSNSGEVPIQVLIGNDPVELKAGGFYSVPLSLQTCTMRYIEKIRMKYLILLLEDRMMEEAGNRFSLY
jgi:hypothetical protein